ncbi:MULTISPECIES: hypothetical protein [unclassified Streptomyces]|nr:MULTISPECIES: hypothetical protein [unclassified Streptomyces]MBT2406080.1 hypothetical protein [Streptomyces sp. ISL-21]MBT2457774.1 hypothetical protein [Streptomyces sp. ISL-86]MBT2610859.1 hypothetical protein [Streptomyces sp. ISL-87]
MNRQRLAVAAIAVFALAFVVAFGATSQAHSEAGEKKVEVIKGADDSAS